MDTAESMVAQALIKPDAKQVFAERCEEIYETWMSLLRKTSLPDNATCDDDSVIAAIRTLDNIITNPEDEVISRLAHIQLARMLAVLKKKVKNDRRHGLIDGIRGQGDATVAIHIYMCAAGVEREAVHGLTRLCNRWDTILAEKSPLLLFTFTEVADRMMYVWSFYFPVAS